MADNPSGTTVDLLVRIRTTDDQAAKATLYERFGAAVGNFARRRLRRAPCRTADDGDLKQSAFRSLFRRAKEGGLTDVVDRDRLLSFFARRTGTKARGIYRQEHWRPNPAEKAIPKRWQTEVDSPEQRPDAMAERADDLTAMLACLPTEELRRVFVLWRNERTIPETAESEGISEQAVQRRRHSIRAILAKAGYGTPGV